MLGAPAEEVEAATAAVTAALAHPLMARARDAWRASRCRRETPMVWRQPDGSLVEGVLDLAFEDAGGWTVVDLDRRGGRRRACVPASGTALRVNRGQGDWNRCDTGAHAAMSGTVRGLAEGWGHHEASRRAYTELSVASVLRSSLPISTRAKRRAARHYVR